MALRRTPRASDAADEVGLVTLLAVLVSPIAWLYYYALAWPAWISVLARPTLHATQGRHLRVATLIVAGILTSGVLTLGLYPPFLWFIPRANSTCGGLRLLTVRVAARSFPRKP